jgi:hypothetical protein
MSEYFRAKTVWEIYLQDLQMIAASQPTVSPEDICGRSQHSKFRDNYYLRFPEIRRIREEVATDVEVFYVRMVMERFGYDLVGFYEQNLALCDSICEGVEAKYPYDLLTTGYNQLVTAELAGSIAPGSARSLQGCTAFGLGIEAIGMYYWDRLNPLLEEAYNLMDTQTLNAPFLTR